MDFFNDLSGKLKKASSAAAPKIQEMSRSIADGVNSLMVNEGGSSGLYAEDEAVGAAVAAVEEVRITMRGLVSDIKAHRRDLLAASRSQQALGERIATSASGMQQLYEKNLPEERIMAQLALSASEISSSTLVGRYATEFGAPLEKLAAAFEDKYSRDIAELKRTYAAAKTEYLRHKRAAADATDEGRRYDHQAQAEAIEPKWRSLSGPLLDLCERVTERTIKRLNDILLNLATFRMESSTKIHAGCEHAGQAAMAFRTPEADAAPETPSEPAAEDSERPVDQVD